MSYKATTRAMDAAQKRQEREAKKRQRELERQAKERAKLSAQEQARLEVETFENALDVLLSVHKEQAKSMDWVSIAASLPPVPPIRQSHNEMKARQRLAITHVPERADDIIDQAKQRDEQEYKDALGSNVSDHAQSDKMSSLARRILDGDTKAYIAAIEELGPFSEITGVGSSIQFTVHSPRIIEVALSTNGRQAIPMEIKTLSSAGKISVKAMPKTRFIEIYQDHVCGCVLRVARELFALLQVETILISASTEALDTRTGQTVKRPFLSVVIPRATRNQLNFELLDPSDSIMGMTHRGDLKASRNTGDFEFITPLTVADISHQDVPATASLITVLAAAQRLRADLAAQHAALNPEPAEAIFDNGENS